MIENDTKEDERLQARNKFDANANALKESKKFEELDGNVKIKLANFVHETSNRQNETQQFYEAALMTLYNDVDEEIKKLKVIVKM